MKLKRLFLVFNSLTIALLFLLVFSALLMYKNQLELRKYNEIMNIANLLADDLKHSSDDLTLYCRSYVMTGDSIWEHKYWEALDIRNGNKSTNGGVAFVLLDSIKNVGLTQAEYNKLKDADDYSNELGYSEKVAFNAMKGLFDDGNGNFTLHKKPDTALARRIMFDSVYHQNKLKIMQPIKDFSVLLSTRTEKNVENSNQKSKYLLLFIIGLVVLIIAVKIISFFVLNHKISNQIKALDKLNKDKDRLISILAHDLKSPFNGILGFLNLLVNNVRKYPIDKIEKYLILVQKSSNQVYELMDDILVWITAQSGKQSFNPQNLKLKTVCSAVIDKLELVSIADRKSVV